MTQEQVKNKIDLRTKIIAAFVIVACLSVAGIGLSATIAYFTSQDEQVNNLTVDEGLEGKMDLVEPNWCADQATDMVPTQTVAKDPKIFNTGDIDTYMFAEVKVPATKVRTVAADGSLNDDGDVYKPVYLIGDGEISDTMCGVEGHDPQHGLYKPYSWVKYDTTEGSTWGSGWTVYSVQAPTEDNEHYVYTLTYSDIVPAKTAAETHGTTELFKAVQLDNFIESSELATAQEIIVTGHAIQAEGFSNVSEAMTAYNNQSETA